MNERLHCWIAKRTTKNGQRRWRACWIDPEAGKERARHFNRKVDAQTFLDNLRGELAAGNYLDPAGGNRLFRDYALGWAAAQVHRPTTVAQLESHLRTHILPAFGARPLRIVKPSDVQAFVRDLAGHLAPATVQAVYRWLSVIFRAAVEDGLIRQSPCRRITLPKRQANEHVVPLLTEDVLALAEAIGEPDRGLVLLAAGAGLRQAEAFGLTVDRINFLHRTLRVDRQLVAVTGEPQFGPPKTPSSVRTLPLPNVILEALSTRLAAHPAGSAGLVFTDAQGRPWRRNRWYERWRRAVAGADAPPGTGFHELRHYFASLLISQGASIKTVQQRLGHASAMVTLDIYGHLWPDADNQTRQAVDAVLGRADPTAVVEGV
jgi:integrase